jgi:hypothetical protein
MARLDPSHNSLVHKKDNGETLVVESGGQINLMPGAKMGPSGSPALPIAGANQAVATDAASVIVLANALRAALISAGIIKGSA